MSLGAQFQKLGQQAAAFRQAIFGTTTAGAPVQIEYDRGAWTGPGYYSPVKNRQQTEEAGFIEDFDSIIRILKSSAPTLLPELNKRILIRETKGNEGSELRFTIESILGSHPASVEWVLGCNAAN